MNGAEAKVGNKMAPAPLFGQLRVDQNGGSEMTSDYQEADFVGKGKKIKGKPARTVGRRVTVEASPTFR